MSSSVTQKLSDTFAWLCPDCALMNLSLRIKKIDCVKQRQIYENPVSFPEFTSCYWALNPRGHDIALRCDVFDFGASKRMLVILCFVLCLIWILEVVSVWLLTRWFIPIRQKWFKNLFHFDMVLNWYWRRLWNIHVLMKCYLWLIMFDWNGYIKRVRCYGSLMSEDVVWECSNNIFLGLVPWLITAGSANLSESFTPLMLTVVLPCAEFCLFVCMCVV